MKNLFYLSIFLSIIFFGFLSSARFVFADTPPDPNPYFSNVSWGYDQQDRLYIKFHAEQAIPY